MKSVLLLSILLCITTTFPALGALSPEDLDKIRLILKEEVDPIKTEIAEIKQDIASLNGRVDGIEKIITWLMVLIVVAVGVPQVIVAWRSRKDQEQDKKIAELTHEIEALKQQRIVNP